MAKPKDVLSDNSNKEYARIIKAIGNAGYKDDDIDSLEAYFQERKYSLPSKRVNINACLNKHKSNVPLCDKLRKWVLDLKIELDKSNENQEISEKQEAKHIDWDKLLEIAVPAINNEKYPLEERILIGLYTQLQPVRNDYTHMKLYTEEPEVKKGTYFIINDTKKEVVINDHKTAKKNGAIRQHLPERLAEMITMWFKDETEMFPISENAMSLRIRSLFKHIFGKPLTICSLRHSRITFLYKNAPMPKEAKQVANAMGHSVGEAHQYRFAPK
jgi:integrase